MLITGHDRSLVTNLEAANHFTVEHLDAADNWAVVREAILRHNFSAITSPSDFEDFPLVEAFPNRPEMIIDSNRIEFQWTK